MLDRVNLVTHYICIAVGAVSALDFNQRISLAMLFLALVTFLFNVYYKRRELDFRQKEIELQKQRADSYEQKQRTKD